MRAAWLALLLGGCITPASTFTCDNDEQCSGGTCQPATHFCSYTSATCDSGQAYGDGAGSLSGECVPFDGPPAVCGNGMVEPGEDCEDGNQDATDDCVDCTFARCGDGKVQANLEDCDDGNADDTDGCNSLCLDCSGGAASVVVNGHCYIRFDTATNFNNASDTCAQHDAILATIKSASDNTAITDLLQTGSYWIGLTNGNGTSVFWQDDELATFTSFATGTPTGAGGCWTIDDANGQWTDRNCAGTPDFPFVCEKRPWTRDPMSRHAYHYTGGGNAGSYDEAEADCVSRGGHLVAITDATELATVDAISSASKGWIGLNDTAVVNTFVWTSGEPATFFNWASGEPNATGTCVVKHADGTWTDEGCVPNFGNGYVCEVAP